VDQLYNTSVTVSDFVYSVSRTPVQREAAAPLQPDSGVQWVPTRHDIQKEASRVGRYLRVRYLSRG
jgi:hypothetical protein